MPRIKSVPLWVCWLVLALLVILAVPAATWRLFLKPPTDGPERAEAAIVLSGTWNTRVEEGLRLLRSGVVRTLVFVGTPDSPAAERLCQGATAEREVICLRPDPDTTRTEIREAAALAEHRGWGSVVLVTSTHHVTRAGMLLRRCFSGRVHVVGTDLPAGIHLSVRLFAKEWAGVLRAFLVERGC